MSVDQAEVQVGSPEQQLRLKFKNHKVRLRGQRSGLESNNVEIKMRLTAEKCLGTGNQETVTDGYLLIYRQGRS